MIQTTLNDAYLTSHYNLPFYRIKTFDGYPYLKQVIFTRLGGISQTPFHSLNMSEAVGDTPATVEHNFELACQSLQITPSQTVSCHLIHKSDILTIDNTNQQRMMGYADGLVTNEPNVYLAMRFADCTPLIFFDPTQKIIGLSHAGWRGTMQNIATETVRAMRQLGAKIKNIIAVIGPSIGPCCYEVGTEVLDAAGQTFQRPDALFDYRHGKNQRPYFDMWQANQQLLIETGVRTIIHTNLCTACNTDKFFSHRAENGRTGRFGVIIGLKE
ncbi:peptidoglycan editing factor PgeF [Anaerolineales bacterium HSG6]|nr:peptidoglycan editing factor PgeF [Anaerolineales bacterium HSG6]MDM8530142.1 peptidoglycan editing factor PgeF [Anaerolineales bacterium HSG25]